MTLQATVIGGGEIPDRATLVWLAAAGYDCLVAADGGADSARRLGLRPARIIGDFDSVTPETLEYFRAEGCAVKHLARQSDTDIEKCLAELYADGYARIALTGVFGDRLDHSLSNLAIALRWSEKVELVLVAGRSVLEVVAGTVRFPATPGAVISLYGFSGTLRVTTDGFGYPLANEPLVFGERESTSNVAAAAEVGLAVSGGRLFVVRDIDEVRVSGWIRGGAGSA